MAITTTQRSQIIQLTVAMFNAAPGATNLAALEAYYVANSSSLSNLADALAASTLFSDQFTDMTNAQMADAAIAHFGLSRAVMLPTEANTAYNFFKTSLDSGASLQSLLVTAVDFLAVPANAAAFPTAAATLANKGAVAEYYSVTKALSAGTIADLRSVVASVDEDSTSVDTAEAAIDSMGTVTGESFMLTDGRDSITGTAADDMIYGAVGQNQDGSLANAFSTGDVIDAGAGTKDELSATIINDNEVDGADADIEINATTTNLEMARFEVIDDADSALVDAGRMDSVEEFWSDNSEGNLTIDDIRLGSKLDITKDITFGIKDSDDTHAFTAAFDSASLTNAGNIVANSQILIEAGYELAVAGVTAETPVEGLYVIVNFTHNGESYTPTNTWVVSEDGTYEGLRAAIEADLIAQGFNGLEVTLGSDITSITTSEATKDLAFTGSQIFITDPNGLALTDVESSVGTLPGAADSDIVSHIEAVDPTTSTTLIESNLILDNAGRASTMGAVDIGGQSNSDKGVEKFNVMVDRDSAITSLTTSDSELQQVVITSTVTSLKDTTSADGDLEIGDINGWDNAAATSIDASAFEGENLMIGATNEIAGGTVTDVNTFSANIAANVRYDAEVGTVKSATQDTEEETYTVTTGSGADEINMDVDYNAAAHDEFSLTITTNSSNDEVNLTFADQTATNMSNSSELMNVDVSLGDGDDTLTVGDSDGIYSNVEADLGAGDDIVFVSNDATKSSWIYNADASGASYIGRGDVEHKVFKLKLSVEFEGLTSDFVEVEYDTTGYTTSSSAINDAIKSAIDAKFSDLLSYEDIRNDGLQITSKVDRDLNLEDLNVTFLAPKYTQHDATGDADSALEQTDNAFYANDSIDIFAARSTTTETEIATAWTAWYPASGGAGNADDYASGDGIYTQLTAASTEADVFSEMFRAADSADVNSSGNDANVNGNVTDDTDTDENMQYTDNPGDAGTAIATSYNKLGLVTSGVDNDEISISKITAGSGDDLIVLNSNNVAGAGFETLVLTSGFGTDTVLNFNTGSVAGTADVIDYVAFLDATAAARGDSASDVAANDMRTEQDVDYAFQTIVANEAGDNVADGAGVLSDMAIDHNKVVTVEFSDIFANLTAAQIATLTDFSDLTADMVTTAINAGTTDVDFTGNGLAESKQDNSEFVVNVVFDRQLEKNAAGTVILGDEVDYATMSVFSANVAYDAAAVGDNLSIDGVVKQGTLDFADMYSALDDLTAESMAGEATQVAAAAAELTLIDQVNQVAYAGGEFVSQDGTFTTASAASLTYTPTDTSFSAVSIANGETIIVSGGDAVYGSTTAAAGTAYTIQLADGATLTGTVDNFTGDKVSVTGNLTITGTNTLGAIALANVTSTATTLNLAATGADTSFTSAFVGNVNVTTTANSIDASTVTGNLAVSAITATGKTITTASGTNTITEALADTQTVTVLGNDAVTVNLVLGDLVGGGHTGAMTVVSTAAGTGTNVIATGTGNDTITAGGGADTITAGAGNDTIVLAETVAAADTIVFAATAALNGADTITGFALATDIINWVQGDAEISLAGGAESTFTTSADDFYLYGGQAAGVADTAASVATAINGIATITAASATAWIAVSDDNSTAIYAWVDIAGVADEVNAAELTLVGTIDAAMTTAQLATAITIA